MRQLICYLFAYLFAFTLGGPAIAASSPSNTERSYQIEVIIFSHITAQGLHSEKWPWPSTNVIPARNEMKVSALPKNDFILAPEQRLLKQGKEFQVLLHLAWQQHIAPPHEAQPIHIYGGNIYNASGHVIGKAEYGQQAYNTQNIWQVNGTITPSLIRYIDLKFNLLFAQPVSTLTRTSHFNNIQGKFAYFRLQQSRRMRSQELNYIGHPLYGVLVKIVPINPAHSS